MSTAEEAPIVLDREGVRVEKEFIISDQYNVPVVEFRFNLTADEAQRVRLLDSIPTEFDSDTVGFHEDMKGEYWESLDGSRVAFERIFRPDEELRTLYGIKGPTTDDAYLFETEPTVYVDEVDEDEVEEQEETDEEVEEEAEIDELADGEVPEEDEVENQAANQGPDTGDGEVPQSVMVQLRDLQARMHEFNSYVNGLQEFIDEEGTAEQLIEELDDLRAQVDNVDDQIAERVSETETEVDGLQENIKSVEGKLGSHAQRINGLEEDYDEVDNEVETLQEDTNDVKETAEDTAQEVDDLDQRAEKLEEGLEEVYKTANEANDETETLREAVDSAGKKATDAEDRVKDVEEELDEMRETMEDVEETLNKLQSAFGG